MSGDEMNSGGDDKTPPQDTEIEHDMFDQPSEAQTPKLPSEEAGDYRFGERDSDFELTENHDEIDLDDLDAVSEEIALGVDDRVENENNNADGDNDEEIILAEMHAIDDPGEKSNVAKESAGVAQSSDENNLDGDALIAAPVRAAADVKPKKPRKAKARKKASVKKPSKNAGIGGIFLNAINFVGFVFAVGAVGAIGATAFAALYLYNLNKDLPPYAQLAEYAPPVTTRVYARDGSLVAEFARERRLFVPIEQIPDYVTGAFVSAEDKSFYEHTGLDIRGLVRAQISNVSNIINGRRLEGGSTITQQVAKNFLLTSEQKIDRKLREMLISRKMEQAFTKEHILELYLNEIYLGNRSYGVAAAALNYFDKPLSELTINEAAYLAAITKGPSNYHPIKNEDRAVERRNWVIGRMLADGRISQVEADQARAQPLGAQLAPPLGAREWTMEYFAEEVRKQIVSLYGVEALYDGGLSVRTSVDPKMQRAAGAALRRWLVAYDQRHGWRGAIDTLDVSDDGWTDALIERLAELRKTRAVPEDLSPWRPALVLSVTDASARIGFENGEKGSVPLDQVLWAREHISANKRGEDVESVTDVLNVGDIVYVDKALPYVENYRGERVIDYSAEFIEGAFALRQPPAINGGLIAIDPHTGRVLAMVGGFSFRMSEFNRAVQAERQPGSTFKPFVYSVALDNGYTPSSTVLDAPFVAPGEDSWYKPGNYIEGSFGGLSTLRTGIEKSRNTMTARLAQDLGIGRIMDYIERFELSDRLPRELAISLGSGETTLMRITSAYSIFVNGGKRVSPSLIDRVQDRTGKTIFARDSRICSACDAPYWYGQAEPQLLDPREQVLDPRTAYQITSILQGVVVRGTGGAVRRASNKPLAGKTGTTNDYKDAWFVGFSPDLATGVFVGFDMPQTLGRGEAGGKVAAPIFADFMVQALENEPGIPFRVPSGVRLVRVDPKSGRPAAGGRSILEAFKTDDIIGAAPTTNQLRLDPLSSSDSPVVEEDDLNGLY